MAIQPQTNLGSAPVLARPYAVIAEFDTPADARPITGRLGALPVAGVSAGHVPPPADGPWPRLASFPTHADLAAVLPFALSPGLVLLDASDPQGYARNWHPPGLEPARHYSYAVQWWAFAALAVVLFVVLNFRRKSP